MASAYLNSLTREARIHLEKTLWENQGGVCFISQKAIDIEIDKIDIDHIIPTRDKGKDEPGNFALTLEHYNRSKQASDLRVARVMARLESIREQADSDDRGVNLNDVLKSYGGAALPLSAKINDGSLTYVDEGQNKIVLALHTDKLSGMKYFFINAPIAAVFHDDKINPRPIGSSIRGLIEEFHKGRPQLHIALGWLNSAELPDMKINLFDGQHKVAAQVLLGATELPVRVFVDPNFDVLLTTNFNAGTTLRQVAFDKSVQRRLGSHMLRDRIERYQTEKGLSSDNFDFSEKDLIEYFKGEQKSVKRYILDNARDAITHSENNRLRDYIEIAGKSTEKPFSYSAIEKTIYSKFISTLVLETPWNYKVDVDENPRSIEINQISRLMSIIAETIYIGKYDDERGTSKIENLIQKGEDIPDNHLRAFRMAKEEILYCWIEYIASVVEQHFLFAGRPINKEKLFQYQFADSLWNNISTFIKNLANLKIWIDRSASNTAFGGKQTYAYWKHIFENGSTNQGHKLMHSGINIIEMIKP